MNIQELPPSAMALGYLMKINNLNGKQLSIKILVSHQIISRWCKGGDIKHSDRRKLCNFFGLLEWEFIKLGTDIQEEMSSFYSKEVTRPRPNDHINNGLTT